MPKATSSKSNKCNKGGSGIRQIFQMKTGETAELNVSLKPNGKLIYKQDQVAINSDKKLQQVDSEGKVTAVWRKHHIL